MIYFSFRGNNSHRMIGVNKGRSAITAYQINIEGLQLVIHTGGESKPRPGQNRGEISAGD